MVTLALLIVLAACSGPALETVRPSPTETPTVAPRPTATSAPTIAYDCPLVTLEETEAIIGRAIANAYQTERGGCYWNVKPDAAGQVVPSVILSVTPWDAAVFRTNYGSLPEAQHIADVGDGAYWDVRGLLAFLYRDHVASVTLSGFASDADLVQLSIDVALAAIPRMLVG